MDTRKFKVQIREVKGSRAAPQETPRNKYAKSIIGSKKSVLISVRLNPRRMPFQESAQLDLLQKMAHESFMVLPQLLPSSKISKFH